MCSNPETVNMLKTADIIVPNSPYSVGICYLPELYNKGVPTDHQDLILLKKNNKQIARHQTTMFITIGRISDLALERKSDRFISVSYAAGEFCNGIVIFDVRKNRVAAEQGCLSYADQCHVKALLDKECKALIECTDVGAEGDPPKQKEIITMTFELCIARGI